jgi:glycosyltransferase involved in cell wall biosynthesis
MILEDMMKNTIDIFAMASNHPDPINKYWATFNQFSIESIVKNRINVKAIIPRPFVPFFSKYAKIPNADIKGLYPKYYPRFFYFYPKKIFYGISGESYSKCIVKYLENSFSPPDLIHAFHIYLDGYGVLKYCKKHNLPLIVTAHGSILRDIWNWKNIRRKIKKTLDYSSIIHCVSKYQANLAYERFVDSSKIEIVHLGVDINKFRLRESMPIKKELKITGEKIILYVGQLIKRKGVEYLIKSLKKISPKYEIKCIIIGEGKEKKNLIKLSRKLSVDKFVIFKGKVTEKELLNWYSISDIFIMPSLNEPWGLVCTEAMASECAIIASRVGGIVEQVKDGNNGYLVEKQNPEELYDKISYLLDNPDIINKMKRNSRKIVIQNGWTNENYAIKMKKIYSNLIDGI